MIDPLVSIIVRTKDRPLLLNEAIKSISDQTYRPIEVCLVNDGGDDPDLEGIKDILGETELCYIKHEKSQGRPAALNSGLDKSEGLYVGILDDDDLYYPSAIRTLLNASIENENRPVYGQVVCRKEGTGSSGREPRLDFTIGEPFCMGRLVFENFIPTNAVLVPRIWIQKTGPFDTDFEIFEDWDWMIKLAQNCEPLFVESSVGEYRIFSDATITGKGGEEMHRTFKEKLLNRHMNKADAGSFLDHVQRTVDKVVLEKDAVAHDLRGRLDELTRQVEIKTEWVRERDERIRLFEDTIHGLEQTVHGLEQTVHGLEQTVHELEDGVRERDREIRRILNSLSYKIGVPINNLVEMVRKKLGKRQHG
ncbi:MAG: glycosyltransferase [Desulfatiglandaceae bacterium]